MRFMLKATINPDIDKSEVIARLPDANAADRARLEQGIQEGVAFVAADRSKAWIIINCESEEQLREITNAMPLNDIQTYEATLLVASKDN